MRINKVFPTANGPNSISFWIEGNKVCCISEYSLSVEDMRSIESMLNLDMIFGFRHSVEETRDSHGRFETSWEIIESPDLDWE